MKCDLRQRIEDAITEAGNKPQAAAIAVCVQLGDTVDLAGNGWFDGDDEVNAAISSFYDKQLAAIEASDQREMSGER